jgi:hypothetical protein
MAYSQNLFTQRMSTPQTEHGVSKFLDGKIGNVSMKKLCWKGLSRGKVNI